MCQLKNRNVKREKDDYDSWIDTFDVNGFATAIRELGEKLEKEQGEADVRHLNKMIGWSNTCAAVGLLTMGYAVNAVSVFALSTWTFTRWTMIAHHTCHGGYDKVPDHPGKKRFNRFRFAVGSLWRRVCDWLDWMMPEAWNVEHNNRHHYNLGEIDDPDLVEANLLFMRESKSPRFFKWISVFFLTMTWKWFYYAPNTYKEFKLARLRRQGKPIPKGAIPEDAVTFKLFFKGGTPFYSFWEFFVIVLLPYMLIHFFILPLPLLLLGKTLQSHGYSTMTGQVMYMNALKNLALAELLTNVHGFIAIVTNHAGDDMYRFREGCRPYSGSFFVRQVVSSVNFDNGSDLVDFMHGYLNYQIEHHLWPQLSMLSYQKAAPIVKKLCAKHGIPYVQENVFIRLKKTVDIMTGDASMRWFPEESEKKYLQLDAIVLAAKTNKSKVALSTAVENKVAAE